MFQEVIMMEIGNNYFGSLLFIYFFDRIEVCYLLILDTIKFQLICVIKLKHVNWFLIYECEFETKAFNFLLTFLELATLLSFFFKLNYFCLVQT